MLREEGKKPTTSTRSGRRLKRNSESQDVDMSSSSSEVHSSDMSEGGSSSEPESVKRDDEWDDECYVCKKEGDVMCCEGCTRVAHWKCLNLR